MDATALLAHILSQTRQNVDFLVAQKQISPDTAKEILAKLPKAAASSTSAVDVLAQKTQNLAVAPPAPVATTTSAYGHTSYSSPPYQPPSATIPAPSPAPSSSSSGPTLPPGVIFRAKALWDYNEHGENPADLSFRGGDIIDVTAETNADWWTGRQHGGKQGLFPANYVERLAAPPAPAAAYTPPSGSAPPYGAAPGYSSYTPPTAPGGYAPPPNPNPNPNVNVYAPPSGYAPPGGYAPTTGYAGPPPPGQAYSPYTSQPGYAPGSSEYNKDGKDGKEKEQEKKKSKFGGLGDTFKTAAVGGVGFGAGSAIGSGIIDSIF